MVALFAHGVSAGQLDNFEKKAGEKQSTSGESRHRSSGYSYYDTDPYPHAYRDDIYRDSFWFWLVSSPFLYRHDDPAGWWWYSNQDEGMGAESWSIWHDPGAATMPYVRADYNYQHINSDLHADDVRLEVGYKLLAFNGRYTRYAESDPTDHLDISQFYGVLRVGGSDVGQEPSVRGWEVGIGGGVVQQQGNETYASGAFTIPIKIYPTDWIGIEFRPAWYRPQERMISDLDLSASVGWRFVQLRGGYRWLLLQGEGTFFDGPYAGVSFSF